MVLNIAGKCAVVTGSTTGMGRAIVERLAAAGCNVMLHGKVDPDMIQVLLLPTAKIVSMPTVSCLPCPLAVLDDQGQQ
jgi:NAD(P)-dependent dehydrogenase (short-subunit alcohol dehydrogenase family)